MMSKLARAVSALAFVVSAVVHLGLVQSAGGLVDSCYAFSFFGISADECRAIGASVRGAGQAEKDWLTLAFTSMRGECCQFLGMGVGSVYALLFLRKGTDEALPSVSPQEQTLPMPTHRSTRPRIGGGSPPHARDVGMHRAGAARLSQPRVAGSP